MSNDNKIKKKTFNKDILGKYAESLCKRQLFLSLGEKDPDWMSPAEKAKFIRKPQPSTFIIQKGQEYEARVYKELKKWPNSIFSMGASKISPTVLTTNSLKQYYNALINPKRITNSLFLLEHKFPFSKNFKNQIFPPKNGNIEAVNVSEIRPDIIILENVFHSISSPQMHNLEDNSNIDKTINNNFENDKTQDGILYYELLVDGSIKKVNPSDNRIAIFIVDIKNVKDNQVSKRYFMEIHFYMRLMSHFLNDNNLLDKYFVAIGKNGIFPHIEDLDIDNPSKFWINVVPLYWKKTKIIFNQILSEIQQLWMQTPLNINDVPVRIQAQCGYCPYIADCKYRLKDNDNIDPKKWKVDLIPGLSHPLVEQLKQFGYNTLGDVLSGISLYKTGNTPDPLYPEIPMIKLKVKALINNNIFLPKSQEVQSYLLPRYVSSAMTLVFESDPINERVYAIGLKLQMSVSKKVGYRPKFDRWWEIWTKYRYNLNNTNIIGKSISEIQVSRVLPFVDQIYNELKQIFSEINREDVINFGNALDSLPNLTISLPGMVRKYPNSKIQQITQISINFEWCDINEDVDSLITEFCLLKKFYEKMVSLLEIINQIESFIYSIQPITLSSGKTVQMIARPNMGVFYWAEEQLEHFQEMIERQLDNILADPIAANNFKKMLAWFNPLESDVDHPYRAKKFFNLQKFAESTIGLPHVINYTWHEMAAHNKIIGVRIKNQKNYWINHYNYMDFNRWLEYVEETDPITKSNQYNELIRQIKFKLEMINRLRIFFQRYGKDIISIHEEPVSTPEFSVKYERFSDNNHLLAQVWVLFAELTNVEQEIDVQQYRTIFPEFSIGKLVAGKVSDLNVKKTIVNSKVRFIHYFYLKNISSNMKITEGDRFLLIPNEMRDQVNGKSAYNWLVTIEDMVWDNKVDGFKISTEPFRTDLIVKAQSLLNKTSFDWYLYPITFDAWVKKLKIMLGEKNLGSSFWGHYLTYIWGINFRPSSIIKYSPQFELAEIYYYIPLLLVSPLKKKPRSNLFTNISPKPDNSQKMAINLALNHILFGIQGPPGTGKSQTITALVDEYIKRRKQNKKAQNKEIRILISSFSYAALKVLIEKFRSAHDVNNSPIEVSKAQLIFVHSDFQEPVSNQNTNIGINSAPFKRVDHVRRVGNAWRFNDRTRVITATKPLTRQMEPVCIIFANAHSLFQMKFGRPSILPYDFSFDLIIVDEASQLPTDYFTAILQYIKKGFIWASKGFNIPVIGEIDSLDDETDEVGVNIKQYQKISIENSYFNKELSMNQIESKNTFVSPNQINDDEINIKSDNQFLNNQNYDKQIPDNQILDNRIDELDLIKKNNIEFRTEFPFSEEYYTQIVIVGDYNQLPPVQPIKPPRNLMPILDSTFAYYVKYHKIPNYQLKNNYRSHKDIVGYTSTLDFYEELTATPPMANRMISGKLSLIKKEWVKEILDPKKVVSTLIHYQEHEMSVSPIEAEVVKDIIIEYYRMNEIKTEDEEINFWKKKIGVVAPHNAQGRLIIRRIMQEFQNNFLLGLPLKSLLKPSKLMFLLKQTIYSVEKFQGSDRECIIASIAISDPKQLESEAEFIYDLNRFNVLTSRPKSKMILVCSKKFIEYFPKDIEIFKQSVIIHNYAMEYCNLEKWLKINLDLTKNKKSLPYLFSFRWHSYVDYMKNSNKNKIKNYHKIDTEFNAKISKKMNSYNNQIEKERIETYAEKPIFFNLMKDMPQFDVYFLKIPVFEKWINSITNKLLNLKKPEEVIRNNRKYLRLTIYYRDLDKISDFIPEINQVYNFLKYNSSQDKDEQENSNNSSTTHIIKQSPKLLNKNKKKDIDFIIDDDTDDSDLF